MADSLSTDSNLSSITFCVKGGVVGVEPGYVALFLLLEEIEYKRLSVHLQFHISGVGPLSPG